MDEYLTIIGQIKDYKSLDSTTTHCRHCDDELKNEDDLYNGLCQSCAECLTTTLN